MARSSRRNRKSQESKNSTRAKSKNRKVIEHGDIFFFYRPKIDTQEVKDIEGVQRFYMVMSPETSKNYRLFLLGQKQLPEIVEGKPNSEERNWALNVLTTSNP